MAEKLDILHLDQFDEKEVSQSLYVNVLKDHLRDHKEAIAPPHKHSFFLVVAFSRGEGVHEVDFERYTVQPGSIFFLAPGQFHHWELSADADGFIFFHSQEFFDIGHTQQSILQFPFFSSQLNSNKLHLSIAQFPPVLMQFRAIWEEYQSPGKWGRRAYLLAQLNQLYIYLSRAYIDQDAEVPVHISRYSDHLRELEKLIEANFTTEKAPAFYADRLHMTVRHLNRIVQESLGKTTTELVTDRVILEAKRLLVHTSMSIARVAETLGYVDYPYFSRVFKKGTGKPPVAFAKLYQRW